MSATQVFVFSRTAVLVAPYAAAEEYGVRLEVRMLDVQPHHGTSGAAQRIVIDRPVWRADIFEHRAHPPGTFASAHFHPRFGGLGNIEAGERITDPALSASPRDWLRSQLSRLDRLYEGAGLLLAGVPSPWLDEDRTALADSLQKVMTAFESAYGSAVGASPGDEPDL